MKTIGYHSPGLTEGLTLRQEKYKVRKLFVCRSNLYHLTVDCKPNTDPCDCIVTNQMLHQDEPRASQPHKTHKVILLFSSAQVLSMRLHCCSGHGTVDADPLERQQQRTMRAGRG